MSITVNYKGKEITFQGINGNNILEVKQVAINHIRKLVEMNKAIINGTTITSYDIAQINKQYDRYINGLK